jgi:FKBP-type peptidyl-prolyl cis-trans isomerase FklB
MELQNDLQKFSYAIGMNVATNLHQQGIEKIDPAALAKAFADTLEGNTQLKPHEAQEVIQQFFAKASEAKHAANVEQGKAFLAENSKKAGVVTLPSGLQYQILKEGNGPKPKATDTVKTHYHGTLINGEVFDSSVQRGQPATFPVNGVIQGWVEALQLMPTGSTWKLFVPYQLAYGDRGAGGKIGPCTALVFEVELIAIEN